MSDHDDEPEALLLVKAWFRRAGRFKTASAPDPYEKQQKGVLRELPKIINVAMALDLAWAMDSHHQGTLSGGASLNKALAIIRSPLSRFLISETSLRNAWSRYKPVAHLCAGFSFAFEVARRESPDGLDEWMKCAYHEELHVTLSAVAAYQRFATCFRKHGKSGHVAAVSPVGTARGRACTRANATEGEIPQLSSRAVFARKAALSPSTAQLSRA
jgi:hypothetical protein